jgi:hypothetical protein
MLQQIRREVRAETRRPERPDLSEFVRIVTTTLNDPYALVGSWSYFIRERSGGQGDLFRVTPPTRCAAPRIELVDGDAYGIQGEDLDLSVHGLREYEGCPGVYQIPDHVHRILGAILETD